jgi:c-di-GMP-binding flagellar brake protein YcgR
MADIDQYLIRQPKQVLSHLKLLSENRCLLSAAFGSGDKDTFITAIMEIDEKKQTITIDCSPKEYLNKKLLDTAIIKFSTSYQGIRASFEGRKVKKAGTPEQPAFIVPIPSSILWLQRRQFYRTRSPLSKNSFCAVTFTNPKTEEQTSVDFKLYDLSASGFSFHYEQEDSTEFASELAPSTIFENCKLILEGEADQPLSFEVRHHLVTINPNNQKKVERFGCRILNTTPRTESTILRYMQNIERELKQKSL